MKRSAARLANRPAQLPRKIARVPNTKHVSHSALVICLMAILPTSACVSTREAPPVGADASTALTRCILVNAQTIAPKAINLDAAARAVVAACSFQVQAQRSALLAKSPGYGPQVGAELDKLERDHLEMAKEQVVLNRGR
jgi:hypothetical protein